MGHLLKRCLLLAVAAVACFAVSWAKEDSGEAGDKKQLPPSFRPGAAVTLAITIKAPRHWNLNHLVPLRLEFDEEYLKEAPFTVEQAVFDFSFEDYVPSYTAEIPLALQEGLPDGVLSIPLAVLCSICDEGGESCTFSGEDIAVALEVKSKAAAEEENQALGKGKLPLAHQLAAP